MAHIAAVKHYSTAQVEHESAMALAFARARKRREQAEAKCAASKHALAHKLCTTCAEASKARTLGKFARAERDADALLSGRTSVAQLAARDAAQREEARRAAIATARDLVRLMASIAATL